MKRWFEKVKETKYLIATKDQDIFDYVVHKFDLYEKQVRQVDFLSQYMDQLDETCIVIGHLPVPVVWGICQKGAEYYHVMLPYRQMSTREMEQENVPILRFTVRQAEGLARK